ncbi:1017_t:CDS:2 [Paraglomus brasilianum]|uniref:1017_t:CDS:1 n=1 Tax=Paraglomus brasilianum TaxID=144538 RepID=A0A9N8VFP1_9GLOM|nr:1017_t:CDS:2 [Paraglomus brasilianum]
MAGSRLFLRSSNLSHSLFQTASNARLSNVAVRKFSAPSTPLMKDVILDLYLKEMKQYKPSLEKIGAEVGAAKELHMPSPQKVQITLLLNDEQHLPPVIDGDYSTQLASYEVDEPEPEAAAVETILENELLGGLEERPPPLDTLFTPPPESAGH